MNNIEFRDFTFCDDNFKIIERIRKEAFNIEDTEQNDYYYQKIKNNSIYVIQCYYNNELVGGAYISNYLNSLFIEQIFIIKKYQKSDLHLGTKLMKYIIDNKRKFETVFDTQFSFSRLESCMEDHFYENLGYSEEQNVLETMKRRI